ncbi:MAG: hypothetical protein JWP47_3276 [Polaromonas sp.]|nr:hypothetical protein [Polaromonas sp.]
MSEGQRIPYHASALPVTGARSVLVLAPHPDDEVFGCGGCAALYAMTGVPVHALILTDGGLGGVAAPNRDLAATRRDEVLRAADILGFGTPLFAEFPDRSLGDSSARIVDLVVRRMKHLGADVLFAPSFWEIHPDHLATAQIALNAIQRLGEGYTLVQYEVGVPLMPSHLIDITAVLQRKHAAMQCFGSQLAVQAYDKHINALNVFRTYTLQPGVDAAEGVRVATVKQATEDPFGLVFQGTPHPLRVTSQPERGWASWRKRWSNLV